MAALATAPDGTDHIALLVMGARATVGRRFRCRTGSREAEGRRTRRESRPQRAHAMDIIVQTIAPPTATTRASAPSVAPAPHPRVRREQLGARAQRPPPPRPLLRLLHTSAERDFGDALLRRQGRAIQRAGAHAADADHCGAGRTPLGAPVRRRGGGNDDQPRAQRPRRGGLGAPQVVAGAGRRVCGSMAPATRVLADNADDPRARPTCASPSTSPGPQLVVDRDGRRARAASRVEGAEHERPGSPWSRPHARILRARRSRSTAPPPPREHRGVMVEAAPRRHRKRRGRACVTREAGASPPKWWVDGRRGAVTGAADAGTTPRRLLAVDLDAGARHHVSMAVVAVSAQPQRSGDEPPLVVACQADAGWPFMRVRIHGTRRRGPATDAAPIACGTAVVAHARDDAACEDAVFPCRALGTAARDVTASRMRRQRRARYQVRGRVPRGHRGAPRPRERRPRHSSRARLRY